jgi:hypothetical protein
VQVVAQPFREEIRVPGAPAPVGVGTYAVRAGDLIFVQGFTAQDEHGHAVGGSDAAAQARFALEKIRRCLETVGGTGTCAFMPRDVQHAWKNSGAETARVLFLYTPATAGGLVEEQQRTQDTIASMSEGEKAEQRQRYGWEIIGPNPL